MRLLACWMVVVCACADPEAPGLVATSPEPPGANCEAGGIAIQVGRDTNGNDVLDADEITSTSYVCQPVPAPPTQQLVRVTPEPAGPNCEYGGQAIAVGVDSNHDGSLDDAEVTAVSYVCAGAPGAQTLVAVTVEPAGAHCPYGGQAIQTGSDVDHDGVLDAAEVTSTSYVCATSSGQQALIRVEPEPAGPHCSAGGTAISVGIDQDADGLLDASEVQSTSYLCGAPPQSTIIQGDVVVHNSLDLAMLDGVTEITGNLIIEMSTLTDLNLPVLQHVGGTIVCWSWDSGSPSLHVNCPLTSIRVPALTSASFLVSAALETIDVSALVSSPSFVLENIHVSSLTLEHLSTGNIGIVYSQLMSLSAPVLVTGGVGVYDAPLSALDIPLLTNGDGVSVRHAPLQSLSAPSLTEGMLVVEDVPQLTSISAPSLAHATHLSLYEADALTELSLPALEAIESTGVGGTELYLMSNDLLANVSFPLLSSAAHIMIENNPALPTCMAQAIAQQANATSSQITGNDDTATCP